MASRRMYATRRAANYWVQLDREPAPGHGQGAKPGDKKKVKKA